MGMEKVSFENTGTSNWLGSCAQLLNEYVCLSHGKIPIC